MSSTHDFGATTEAVAPAAAADDSIRALVVRLSRPHRSGGDVIERAAILAEGAHSKAIINWILTHDGRPETTLKPAATPGGLHGARRAPQERPPQAYVLPHGALDAAAQRS